ncbi:hypothetical protein F5148DRAFT_1179729 [Russula earlei]|uniref:Uncharacterized protein n=1 Tax=Russula earlei TaxID=71964 RepID=A0ACC0UFI2_9AGAM|nr:hypothetical protein F5148DRAFT_1179729 [Russula earlei]
MHPLCLLTHFYLASPFILHHPCHCSLPIAFQAGPHWAIAFHHLSTSSCHFFYHRITHLGLSPMPPPTCLVCASVTIATTAGCLVLFPFSCLDAGPWNSSRRKDSNVSGLQGTIPWSDSPYNCLYFLSFYELPLFLFYLTLLPPTSDHYTLPP